MEHLSFCCPSCQKAVSLPDNYCQSCGERLLCVQILSGTALTQTVADKVEPTPYIVSPGFTAHPVRWLSPECAAAFQRRASDQTAMLETMPAKVGVQTPRRNMSRLLYEVANDIAPEDPCEITVVLTQAQLYHSGSYQKPQPTRNDGRALVDMCVQLSAVALAVVTVGFGTEAILNPHEGEINRIFKAAKTALISARPERAADILESIPAGTPNILNAERRAIFEDAMIARARQRTGNGLYSQALSDLSRVRAQSPLSAEATRLAIQCRNLQAFSLDTNTTPTPRSEFVKTDADRQIAAVPVTTPVAVSSAPAAAASLPLSTHVSAAPTYPVSPYKAFRTWARENKGETKALAKSSPKSLESQLPPQLLPDAPTVAPPSEGTSYWMQESSAVDTDEPATTAPDIEPLPAKDINPSPDAPAPAKREWKTAPSGKTKFADN